MQVATNETTQTHCSHEAVSRQTDMPIIGASSKCHHSCGDPEKASLQKLRPESPQFVDAVMAVVASIERDDTAGVALKLRVDRFQVVLPDIPSASLRI